MIQTILSTERGSQEAHCGKGGTHGVMQKQKERVQGKRVKRSTEQHRKRTLWEKHECQSNLKGAS